MPETGVCPFVSCLTIWEACVIWHVPTECASSEYWMHHWSTHICSQLMGGPQTEQGLYTCKTKAFYYCVFPRNILGTLDLPWVQWGQSCACPSCCPSPKVIRVGEWIIFIDPVRRQIAKTNQTCVLEDLKVKIWQHKIILALSSPKTYPANAWLFRILLLVSRRMFTVCCIELCPYFIHLHFCSNLLTPPALMIRSGSVTCFKYRGQLTPFLGDQDCQSIKLLHPTEILCRHVVI